MLVYIACKRFFGQISAFFKCTSNSYAYHHRRAGIGACVFYSLQNSILYPLNTVCRFQHENPAHIFTAEAFGGNCYFHLIATYNGIMDNSRRVIFCIFTDKRVFYYGFAQIPFCIPLSDSLMYCIFQYSSGKMNFLARFHKNNCHARVLTDWNHILCSNLHIFHQLTKNLAPQRGFFRFQRPVKNRFHVI